MKTPKSIKLNAQSQLAMVKTNAGSGLAIEGDLNYKSNNVIIEGTVKEAFADFDDDEPKAGKKPDPPKKDEGMPLWEKIAIGVAVVAAVAVVCVAFPEVVAAGAELVADGIEAAAWCSRAFQTASTVVKVLGAIGAVVGGGTDITTQYFTNGGFDNFSLKELVVSTLSGAVSGAFAAIPLARGTEAAVNGVIGGVQSAETGGSFTDIALATGLSAVAGWAGGEGFKPGLYFSAERYKAAARAAGSAGFKAGSVASWVGTVINKIRSSFSGDKEEEKLLC